MSLAVAGCGGADFGCANLKSTAGEPEGDVAYAVTATKCDDGVDKEVQCTAVDAGWDCICITDGQAGASLSDPQSFHDQVRSTDQHENSLDEAMILASADCGW